MSILIGIDLVGKGEPQPAPCLSGLKLPVVTVSVFYWHIRLCSLYRDSFFATWKDIAYRVHEHTVPLAVTMLLHCCELCTACYVCAEELLIAIAQASGEKIWVNKGRLTTIAAAGFDIKHLTTDITSTRLRSALLVRSRSMHAVFVHCISFVTELS